jgi:hypothetical protein
MSTQTAPQLKHFKNAMVVVSPDDSKNQQRAPIQSEVSTHAYSKAIFDLGSFSEHRNNR